MSRWRRAMGFFRPPRGEQRDTDPIEQFWTWWRASGADEAAAAIERREPEALVEPLGSWVAAIPGNLDWELTRGTVAQHRLIVSAGGVAEKRATARRWLRAAPVPDTTWEYADSRGALPDLADAQITLSGGEPVGFDEFVVAAARNGSRLDVVLHHAAFAALPDGARATLSFHALDAAVGEDDVAMWIGAVEFGPAAPRNAMPLRELPGSVAAIRDEHCGDDGEPTWVLLEAGTPEGRRLAAAQVPLHSAFAPDLDRHVGVGVPFADRDGAGLPGPGSLRALREFQAHLVQHLGAAGRLVAHETSAGRRILHFYVDSTGPGADVVRAAVTGWDQGRVDVGDEADPQWAAVRPLRT